jgi:hypothetical protein
MREAWKADMAVLAGRGRGGGYDREDYFNTKIQCCGSAMFFPDRGTEFCTSRITGLNFSIQDPGSRIRIKEFEYFNPKNGF